MNRFLLGVTTLGLAAVLSGTVACGDSGSGCGGPSNPPPGSSAANWPGYNCGAGTRLDEATRTCVRASTSTR